jgi:integrase
LAEWLDDPPGGYLVSPREAMAGRKARLAMIVPGEHYRVSSYRNAVRRACMRLGIPVWFPNQLRHNAATRVRQRFGLEASRAVLGHETVDTTLIYAEKDRDEAKRVMREVG